jgi:hypothetical protein
MDRQPLPAVACTLTTKARAERGLEWADLAALALSHQVLPNGVRSTYELSQAEGIENLVGRELECCGSWLELRLDRDGGAIQLTATTSSPEGVDVIRSALGFETG